MTTNSGVPTNSDGQTVTMVIAPVQSTGTHAPIKLLYGSGVPAASVGNDGDFYRNMDNDDMYGPKLGTWPSAFSIRGYKGDKGDKGDIGDLTDADRAYVDAAQTAAAASQSAAKTSETNAASSASAASSSKSAAATSAANAKTSETNSKTSETNAAASAAAAADSATQASASQTAASNSATAAAGSAGAASTSATNAAASQTAAAASATAAATSKTNAGTSETNAAASAVAAASSASAAATSKTNAGTSETNALASKNAAATSAGNAATSEANALASKNAAATSASNAATSETNAAASASAAASSASAADASKTAAAASASAAATSKTNAATSETNAASSKTAAANSATAAAGSATAAANSAGAAATSETNAAASATAAATSKTNAKTSETNSATSETNAAASATAAAQSKTAAAASATAAAGSASDALGSANTATTKASAASASAAAAGASETNAANSATQAAYARDAAQAAASSVQNPVNKLGDTMTGPLVIDPPKVSATVAALNAPTLRVIDSGNGTAGGLSLEAYQPLIQFIDRSTSAKNSRMMQNAGQIQFANDPGDNSGAWAASGVILNPDGAMVVGAGASLSNNVGFYANGANIGTGTSQWGFYSSMEFNEASTTGGYSFASKPKTKAATYTVANLVGFNAEAPVVGAGSTITAYTAFRAVDFSTAGTIYGFRGQMASGAGKWNAYMDGSAANYFNGQVLIGSNSTVDTTSKVQITNPTTGHGLTVIRNGQQLQYIAIGTNTGLDTSAPNDHKIVGYSPATAAKPIYIHATTDEAGTVPTNGTVGINFKVLNVTAAKLYQSGNFGLGTNGIVDNGVDQLQVTGSASVTGPLSTKALATPGAATGTGSTTGGSLAAATYYVKIAAVDSLGGLTPVGAESAGVATTGTTSSIAWAWAAVAGAASYRVYYGTAAGGEAAYFTTTTNSFTLSTTSGNTAGTPPTSNTTGQLVVASGASFSGDVSVNDAGSSYSYKLFLKAGTYAPFIRGTNTGAVEFINSANTNANLAIADNGNVTARGIVYSQAPAANSSGAFRTTSDIGGAFALWNTTRTYALQVDTPTFTAAYGGIRWTRWGGRHIAAIDAYEGGTASSSPTIVFHTALQNNAWTFSNSDIVRGAGGAVWGSWNLTPSNYVWKAGDTMTSELGVLANGDQGYYGRFGAGYIKLARYDYGGYLDLARHMNEDYRWRIHYNFNSNYIEFICNGGQTVSIASDGNIYSPAAGGWLSNKVNRGGDTFSGTVYFNGANSGSYTNFGYINSGGASVYTGNPGTWAISIVASNTCVASQWFAVSDSRLKTEIEDLDEAEAIQFVEEVSPKRYLKEGQREWGYLAQDIGKALNGKGSELITLSEREGLEELVDEDGFVSPADHALNVSHNMIIPIHAAVLRNLLRRVAALESHTVH